MKLTYADVLTTLPVDATLQDYLTRCALPLPPTLDWTDVIATSRAIIDAIETCPDTAIRDSLIVSETFSDTPDGTAVITDGKIVFTPATNFNGTATVSYVVTDGTADSAPATVTITVDPVNDAPTISAADQAPFFTEMNGADTGANAVVINSSLSVADLDGTVTSATVTITNTKAGDELLFTDTAKIQGAVTTDGSSNKVYADRQVRPDADQCRFRGCA